MHKQSFDLIYKEVFTRLDGLDKQLTYHCKEHTADVLQQCKRIAAMENVTDDHQLYLLTTAALYHDSGFLEAYADHETHSANIFLRDAGRFGFSEGDRRIITDLINATRVPQTPHTLLQQIICDADLDYLGRTDFFEIGETLRKEFLHYNIVADDNAWQDLQLQFLKTHHYHTQSSQQLREPEKQKHLVILQQMKEKLAG